jgi:hypothetical protein
MTFNREMIDQAHKICNHTQAWADEQNAAHPEFEFPFVACEMAGQRHPICDGHRIRKGSAPGQPCRKSPRLGAMVCSKHGGEAPNAKALAERRLAAATADWELKRFAEINGEDVDPASTMADALRSKTSQAIYLRTVVNGLSQPGLKQIDSSGRFERPSVWVDMLWTVERDLVAICKTMVDIGFAERQARYVDAQAMLLLAGLQWMRRELGLADDDRWDTAERQMLEALGKGGPPDGHITPVIEGKYAHG